jgi:hypothetical protein
VREGDRRKESGVRSQKSEGTFCLLTSVS